MRLGGMVENSKLMRNYGEKSDKGIVRESEVIKMEMPSKSELIVAIYIRCGGNEDNGVVEDGREVEKSGKNDGVVEDGKMIRDHRVIEDKRMIRM